MLPLTRDEYVSSLARQGLSRHDAEDIAAMSALMESGPIAGTTDELASVRGRAPRTFEE
ncbi:hypothetical protein AB0D65_19955 [Streptomyces griseoloalbus]|uniref:Antitoxin VbhA domain-containing protein n=1 Tax=Streptomyces griseoloalbus TaxID=67303 RepID=A0ABV3E7U3_9ACTN